MENHLPNIEKINEQFFLGKYLHLEVMCKNVVVDGEEVVYLRVNDICVAYHKGLANIKRTKTYKEAMSNLQKYITAEHICFVENNVENRLKGEYFHKDAILSICQLIHSDIIFLVNKILNFYQQNDSHFQTHVREQLQHMKEQQSKTWKALSALEQQNTELAEKLKKRKFIMQRSSRDFQRRIRLEISASTDFHSQNPDCADQDIPTLDQREKIIDYYYDNLKQEARDFGDDIDSPQIEKKKELWKANLQKGVLPNFLLNILGE